MMRKICIINQKGGVAKTTTTISLATCLAVKGKRVLVIDLDPQGNVGTSLCIKLEKTVYDLLVNEEEVSECIINVSENFDAIISDSSLAKAELILAGQTSRETVLRRKLEPVFNYDYIFIDCPPSLSLLNINALIFSQEAFVPVATDFLALEALKKMTNIIDEINELFDHDLRITNVIPTMFDKRSKASKQTLEQIRIGYEDLVTEPIRVNTKLKEAPSVGKDIFDFAKSSRGAKDYLKLTQSVMANEYYY